MRDDFFEICVNFQIYVHRIHRMDSEDSDIDDGFLNDVRDIYIPYLRLISSEVSKNRIQSKPKRENFKLPKAAPWRTF